MEQHLLVLFSLNIFTFLKILSYKRLILIGKVLGNDLGKPTDNDMSNSGSPLRQQNYQFNQKSFNLVQVCACVLSAAVFTSYLMDDC